MAGRPWNLLKSKPFDLVLLDIMMPNVNGYEVLAAMKASENLRHIPVIMISAVDEIDSVVRCIELGAEDYLPKPFNPTLLRARVGACMERKRLHDQATGAHARALRGAGAADGDLGGAAGHLQLARRTRAGVPGHVGERDAPLRSEIWPTCSSTRGYQFRRGSLYNAPPAFAETGGAYRWFGPTDPLAAQPSETGGPYRRH